MCREKERPTFHHSQAEKKQAERMGMHLECLDFNGAAWQRYMSCMYTKGYIKELMKTMIPGTTTFVKREEGSGEDFNLEFDAAKQNTGNTSRMRQHSFDGSRVSPLSSLPLPHNNSTTGFLSIFHAQILL